MSLRDILRMIFGGARPTPPPPPPVVPPPPPPPPPAAPDDFLKRVVDLHNKTRDAYGLPPLELDGRLVVAAQSHADWMARVQTLSHTGVNLSTPGSRARDVGYLWRAVGENIAAGQRTPEEVVKAWMGSPGHKGNILGSYQHFGVGFARDARGRLWWCVIFGRPTVAASTTLVVVEENETNYAGGIWAPNQE